ncbi:MAG: hypothetical protein NTV07_01600, partial [Candidatus Omnitrophica bacterium]|nr:hypothetical protein [Candidatus Omnitrophota bacterium]
MASVEKKQLLSLPTLPAEVKKMPAYEIVKILGVFDARVTRVQRIKRAAGLMVYTVQMPARTDMADYSPEDRAVFGAYNDPSRKYDLLYNKKGYLLAIFPHSKNSFLDLAPYYFNIPKIDDPTPEGKWSRFAAELKEDEALINAYNIRGRQSPFRDREPYIYIELNKKTGACIMKTFAPEDFLYILPQPSHKKHQIIIPLYPTVYSP